MSLITNWGYTLTDADSLTELLTDTEYDHLTGSRYSEDERIMPNIRAASSAIRNYCGWHIYPSLACEWSGRLGGVSPNISANHTRRGWELLIQLPAKFVSAVKSVAIAGEELDSGKYFVERNGILTVHGISPAAYQDYDSIVVRYTAGLPSDLMDGIRELAAHRVTHALASSNGITSEAAGGVSVTYNTNWVNSARATALPDDNKEVLGPYRLQGVF